MQRTTLSEMAGAHLANRNTEEKKKKKKKNTVWLFIRLFEG